MVHDKLFKASLIILCFMILGMILIGGLTRLTGSGLSIVEWKPVTGILPPLTNADWILEFSKYQSSPEFQKINFGMTLDDFKSIFFLEYIHRLWGRLIGFVLLIPTFLMVFKKQHRELAPLLVMLWILGIGQGVMGWVMVKSGLVHDPHVSPYRLSAHLFLGFMIFGVALWMTLVVVAAPGASSPRRRGPSKLKGLGPRLRGDDDTSHLTPLTTIALTLVLLTALLGGLVAGLKAGLVYNTFPLMGESLIPRELLTQSPWWKDLLENPVSVQFLHRICATTTALFCGGLWIYQRKFNLSPALSLAFNSMMIALIVQFLLGILTLLFVVPPHLALMHQGVAFLVFGCLVVVVFLLEKEAQESLDKP